MELRVAVPMLPKPTIAFGGINIICRPDQVLSQARTKCKYALGMYERGLGRWLRGSARNGPARNGGSQRTGPGLNRRSRPSDLLYTHAAVSIPNPTEDSLRPSCRSLK
jgi:hypothetical protein